MRVVWSDRALDRLAELGAFLADRGVDDWRAVIRRLHERVAVLAEQPRLGSLWPPGRERRVRRLVVGSYLVFYRLDEVAERVFVLTIRHGRERPVGPEGAEP